MKTKRLVTDAMLVAVYFVLSNYLSVNMPGARLTLDVLPVLVAGALFGPLDGALVGFLGNFLFQLTGPYGISVTTVLWALPDAVRGLCAGMLLFERWQVLPKGGLIAALVGISLVFTTLTTGVMYIDCLVFEYAFAAYVPYILTRYIAGVIIAVLMSYLLPPLLKALGGAGSTQGGAHENNGN